MQKLTKSVPRFAAALLRQKRRREYAAVAKNAVPNQEQPRKLKVKE